MIGYPTCTHMVPTGGNKKHKLSCNLLKLGPPRWVSWNSVCTHPSFCECLFFPSVNTASDGTSDGVLQNWSGSASRLSFSSLGNYIADPPLSFQSYFLYKPSYVLQTLPTHFIYLISIHTWSHNSSSISLQEFLISPTHCPPKSLNMCNAFGP